MNARLWTTTAILINRSQTLFVMATLEILRLSELASTRDYAMVTLQPNSEACGEKNWKFCERFPPQAFSDY